MQAQASLSLSFFQCEPVLALSQRSGSRARSTSTALLSFLLPCKSADALDLFSHLSQNQMFRKKGKKRPLEPKYCSEMTLMVFQSGGNPGKHDRTMINWRSNKIPLERFLRKLKSWSLLLLTFLKNPRTYEELRYRRLNQTPPGAIAVVLFNSFYLKPI